jgi:hypothetical protein
VYVLRIEGVCLFSLGKPKNKLRMLLMNVRAVDQLMKVRFGMAAKNVLSPKRHAADPDTVFEISSVNAVNIEDGLLRASIVLKEDPEHATRPKTTDGFYYADVFPAPDPDKGVTRFVRVSGPEQVVVQELLSALPKPKDKDPDAESIIASNRLRVGAALRQLVTMNGVSGAPDIARGFKTPAQRAKFIQPFVTLTFKPSQFAMVTGKKTSGGAGSTRGGFGAVLKGLFTRKHKADPQTPDPKKPA